MTYLYQNLFLLKKAIQKYGTALIVGHYNWMCTVMDRWKKEDIEKLQALLNLRKSHKQISTELNRSARSIAHKSMRLGLASKFVANIGTSNCNWKGDDVGYWGIHVWARRNVKKPEACKKCGKVTTRLEIHRIAKDYKRELDGWIYLCKSCHTKEEFEKRVQIEVERRLNTHG